MTNNNHIGLSSLPWNLSWLTVGLALLTIITFFTISSQRSGYYATKMGYDVEIMEPSVLESSPPNYGSEVPMMDGSVTNEMMRPDYYPYPYPYPNPDVPITDTREFLKINYNASMKTRDVPTLTSRIETVVRGYDGRIDNKSSAEKYGYVSFALPQAKYEAFRAELESLVPSQFLKVDISSENLLREKVSLEEQQKQADTALADYKTLRQKIVNAHTSTVQSIQTQIDDPDISDTERLLLRELLVKENSSYTRNLSNADANIKYAQDWVEGVQTQDATLLANVATVRGTVSIQWISLWNMAQLYLPGYWIPAILALLTILSFKRDRRRLIASTL